MKHTYYGDADVGGTVNLDDFNQFLFGFNPANGAPKIWLNGDFNYSGAVNLDDFNLFLFGLANQGGALVSPELFAALTEFVTAEGVDLDLSAVSRARGILGRDADGRSNNVAATCDLISKPVLFVPLGTIDGGNFN